MNLLFASLLLGGTLVPSADLPNVDADECVVVSVDVTTPTPTVMDPDPEATAMQIVVYCGHRVQSGDNGGTRVDRALKIVEVDLDSAEIIVNAANGIADIDGDVFVSR